MATSEAEREAAVDLLTETGGTSDLTETLQDAASSREPSAVVRAAAVSAVSRLALKFSGLSNVEAAGQMLSKRLGDPDSFVRHEAAVALALMQAQLTTEGSTGWSQIKSPISRLLPALLDKDVRVRLMAAMAIRRVELSLEEEMMLLPYFQAADWWAFRACSLAVFGDGSAPLPGRFSTAPRAQVKTAAWDAILARRNSTSRTSAAATVAAGVASLGRSLSLLSEDLRAAVSSHLGLPSGQSEERRKTEDALRHLEDSWWRVRSAAVDYLGKALAAGNFEAGTGALSRLGHTSSRVRLAAAEVLGNLSANSLQDLALKIVRKLLERLEDPVAEVRLAAAFALKSAASKGGIVDPAVEATVQRLFCSVTVESRRALRDVLVAYAEAAQHGPRLAAVATFLLVRCLTSGQAPAPEMRDAAIAVLAHIAPPLHPGAAAVLSRLALVDSEPSLRLAALDALSQLAKRAEQSGAETAPAEGERTQWRTGVAAALEVSRRLLEDPDEVVQEAAHELFQQLSAKQPTSSPAPSTSTPSATPGPAMLAAEWGPLCSLAGLQKASPAAEEVDELGESAPTWPNEGDPEEAGDDDLPELEHPDGEC